MVRAQSRFLKWTIALTAVLALGSTLALAAAEGAGAESAVRPPANGPVAVSIAVVVGLACIGAGIAVGRVGSAALGALSERPELFGRSLVLIALAEGIAIYGLVIGILLMLLHLR